MRTAVTYVYRAEVLQPILIHNYSWIVTALNKNLFLLQRAMGRMLFWGQQGVSPNIHKAVRHYERGAVHWGDPVSMYDYAIVLLQVRVTSSPRPLQN